MSADRALDVDSALEVYLQEIRRVGSRLNLVGSLEPEAIRVHIEDSLAAAAALPSGARVVDLGSGAGFPGVPLAIARPDVDLTLVEIRERRVHFLRHVVRTLSLSCAVLRTKIEDVTESFDVALSRAVASPREMLELGRPCLGPGGELWVWTRESVGALGLEPGREIPIGGDRGRIVRIPREHGQPWAREP